MDKDNVFKSCSFYLDDGDVVHVLIKDFVGDSLSISLNDNDGTQEDDTEITPYGELYTGIYGALYNWHAATDARNICSAGCHVPTQAEFDILADNLGGAAVAGGKLKEMGFIYWNDPNIGATNEVGFYGRGGGRRGNAGVFQNLKLSGAFITSDEYDATEFWSRYIYYNLTIVYSGNDKKFWGLSLRPIKDSTTLTHGQTGVYHGNDDKLYSTIAIGDPAQEWIACNLAETKYRNGDLIPEVTDNAAWAALTTAGMCYYNNVEI